jgi:hypothetical protein
MLMVEAIIPTREESRTNTGTEEASSHELETHEDKNEGNLGYTQNRCLGGRVSSGKPSDDDKA